MSFQEAIIATREPRSSPHSIGSRGTYTAMELFRASISMEWGIATPLPSAVEDFSSRSMTPR